MQQAIEQPEQLAWRCCLLPKTRTCSSLLGPLRVAHRFCGVQLECPKMQQNNDYSGGLFSFLSVHYSFSVLPFLIQRTRHHSCFYWLFIIYRFKILAYIQLYENNICMVAGTWGLVILRLRFILPRKFTLLCAPFISRQPALFKESMSLSVLGNEYLWLTSREYKKSKGSCEIFFHISVGDQ